MVDFVKVKGQEIALTTANTVGNSTVVRVYTPSIALLTFTYANTTVYGTYTLGAGLDEVFIKDPTDTITANTAVRAVSIAYR
jgi:hypothetical protein